MRKAFVRAPLDFTRVSSNFNPNRKHPILNTIRAHRGVDYAASKGTKIKASGDGKVIFKGVKGGYGNVIILQHGENITTLYAHMSKFAAKIRTGQRIKQNQTIGFVGSSGLATAPHLHYEYRINGIHQNPRTVKLPKAAPIDDIYKQDFEEQSYSIMKDLLQFKETQNLSVVFNN
jgi:murein DD-endopeptidase MepM/ murein hydrolase activator NlpD